MQRIRQVNHHLEVMLEQICIAIYAGTLLLAGFQVLFRYGFDYSLYWGEEVMRYGFIWATLLGVCLCHRNGLNIAIEAVTSHLNPRTRLHLGGVVHLLSAVFFVVLIVYGFEVVLKTMPQSSAALGIPMGWIYLSVPVSAVIMLGQTLEFVGDYLRASQAGGEVPTHD